ncbi:MAG: hypothetical protein QY311_02745 [Candidatus Paceibacterota bacterium]|nr:MAG: hypothetical protein QY311_02745 [Candidatus Paceibacterota bacterium]
MTLHDYEQIGPIHPRDDEPDNPSDHGECVAASELLALRADEDRDEVVEALFILTTCEGSDLQKGIEALHEILSQRWSECGSVPQGLASLVRMRMR